MCVRVGRVLFRTFFFFVVVFFGYNRPATRTMAALNRWRRGERGKTRRRIARHYRTTAFLNDRTAAARHPKINGGRSNRTSMYTHTTQRRTAGGESSGGHAPGIFVLLPGDKSRERFSRLHYDLEIYMYNCHRAV